MGESLAAQCEDLSLDPQQMWQPAYDPSAHAQEAVTGSLEQAD